MAEKTISLDKIDSKSKFNKDLLQQFAAFGALIILFAFFSIFAQNFFFFFRVIIFFGKD